jgi:hypothetical protein
MLSFQKTADQPRTMRPECFVHHLDRCTPRARGLRPFVLLSSRPVFSHGRRFYAQLKVDKSAEDFNKLSTDEQLERLTKLNASADNNPEVDLWSLNADLLGRWFNANTVCARVSTRNL